MSKLLKFFALVVMVSTEFGSVQSDTRMKRSSGGVASFVNYQVCLMASATPVAEFHCGGSVVSEHFVLTAAHCVDDPTRRFFAIRAGSVYCYRDGSVHTPLRIIKHNGYMGQINGFMHDIAVIEVAEPLSGPNIGIIPLFERESPQNAYGTVSGWGSVYEGPDFCESPNILQAATIFIHSREACDHFRQMYREQYGEIHTEYGQFCAGNRTTTACHGDSGGPLIFEGFQIGIVSNGAKYCGTLPVFFTEVSQYVGWIRTFIG